MSDTVRQRLDDLNRQIQIQRNIEMHAAMERARLETQRVELMSQMLTSSVAPPATITPMSPYRVVLQPPAPGNVPPPNPASLVDRRRKHKPDGLPSVAAMIETVLRDAPGGLRPCDITAAIRQRWWPDLSGPVVSSTVWHMAERGRLAKTGSTYRLPSTSQTNGANGSTGPQHVDTPSQ
jgi:hypothetical protein